MYSKTENIAKPLGPIVTDDEKRHEKVSLTESWRNHEKTYKDGIHVFNNASYLSAYVGWQKLIKCSIESSRPFRKEHVISAYMA